jgi:hypothetical protein
MEPLCGAPGVHYVVRFGGGAMLHHNHIVVQY